MPRMTTFQPKSLKTRRREVVGFCLRYDTNFRTAARCAAFAFHPSFSYAPCRSEALVGPLSARAAGRYDPSPGAVGFSLVPPVSIHCAFSSQQPL
jgi:hypothetical protein